MMSIEAEELGLDEEEIRWWKESHRKLQEEIASGDMSRVTVISAEDFQALIDSMNNPPAPSEALKALAARYDETFGEKAIKNSNG